MLAFVISIVVVIVVAVVIDVAVVIVFVGVVVAVVVVYHPYHLQQGIRKDKSQENPFLERQGQRQGQVAKTGNRDKYR
mgnify:CR=1 FL=1